MNKKWKIFWIVTASIAALGMVIGLVGVSMGGTWQAIRNQYPNGIGFVNEDHENTRHHGKKNGNISGNMTFSVDEVNSIDIDVTCAELGVYYYDGTEIEVGCEGLPNVLGFDCYVDEENELVIGTDGEAKLGASCGEIWVRIPRDKVFLDVSIDIGVGAAEINDIAAIEMDVAADVGEIEVNDLKAQALDIDCGAGEVTISGSVDGDISIDCGAGQVNCQLAAFSQDSYNYGIEVGAGEVNVGKTNVAGVNVHRTYENGASRAMEIDCGMGEVNIEFED